MNCGDIIVWPELHRLKGKYPKSDTSMEFEHHKVKKEIRNLSNANFKSL